MGRSRSKHAREEKCVQSSGRKNRNDSDHYEDLSMAGNIILKCRKIGLHVTDWILLAQDREK